MADPTRESVLDGIRRSRAEHAGERHHDIDLPGYGGRVVLRFGPIVWDTVDQIAERSQKARKSPRREVNAQADFLIAACREVLVRVGAELASIADDGPVRFDAGLAEALGLPEGSAASARSVLFEAFALANAPDIAIAAVAVELQGWMAETDAEIDEILLGE